MIFNKINKIKYDKVLKFWLSNFDDQNYFILFPCSYELYSFFVNKTNLVFLNKFNYPSKKRSLINYFMKFFSKELICFHSDISEVHKKSRVYFCIKNKKPNVKLDENDISFVNDIISKYEEIFGLLDEFNKNEIRNYLINKLLFSKQIISSLSNKSFSKNIKYLFGALNSITSRAIVYFLTKNNFQVNIFQHGEPFSICRTKLFLEYSPNATLVSYNKSTENYTLSLFKENMISMNLNNSSIELEEMSFYDQVSSKINTVVFLGRYPFGRIESETSILDSKKLLDLEIYLISYFQSKNFVVLYKKHPENKSEIYINELRKLTKVKILDSTINKYFGLNYGWTGSSYNSTAYLELAMNKEKYFFIDKK